MPKPKHYAHEIRKVADLIPYANNSRTHSEEQINQVASSIKEWAIFNDSFAVSRCGVIISLPRKCGSKNGSLRSTPMRVISQYEDKDGYKLATCKGLSKNGQVRVHKLVAAAYLGDGNGLEVNHIDGNKANNNAVDIGLISTGSKHHNTKPVQIEKGGFGFVAFGVRQIESLKLRAQSVHRVARGERRSINGWECDYV